MRLIKVCFYLVIFHPILTFCQVKKSDYFKLSYNQLKKMYFDDTKSRKEKENYARIYLTRAKIDNDKLKIARGYYWYSLLNEGNVAINYLDSVILYSKNLNDKNFPMSAYVEKAYILNRQYKFKDAINNFILGQKYASSQDAMYYQIRLNIAVIKSEDLGETREALEIYKECYGFYKSKNLSEKKNYEIYHEILFDLADAFKSLSISDSARYYNRLGYDHAKATNDKQMLGLFILNEGANLVGQKKYQAAYDSINKAIPIIKNFNDLDNLLAAYYYLGKLHQIRGNGELAVKSYIKVDSIYIKTKYISPEFSSGYGFLVNFYKKKRDQENQLKYLRRYMEVDSTLLANYKDFYKIIKKEYDIPNLVKEKDNLIASLNKKKQFYYLSFLLFIIIIIALIYNQNRMKKIYRSRFEKIISNYSSKEVRERSSINENEENENKSKSKDLTISDSIVNHILTRLKVFEEDKGYLNSNITIQLLSQEFDTNSKYLSKIVNEFKGKTFTQYVNDLRIENALTELQQDKKLKKFTMHALANEFGFNSAESFSTAFYKKSGIKPSYFIKELEKEILNKDR